MSQTKRVKIFLSYSHKDRHLCEALRKHLTPLIRSKIIAAWWDHAIKPGSNWNHEIIANLSESDIVLFLLSSDFLHSEYIFEEEVGLAVERHRSGKSILVPVMLRQCDIESTIFKAFQGLPDNLEPVTSKRWRSRDEAFMSILYGLKRIIGEVQTRKAAVERDEQEWYSVLEADSIEAYAGYISLEGKEKRFQRSAMQRLITLVRAVEVENLELKAQNLLLVKGIYEAK